MRTLIFSILLALALSAGAQNALQRTTDDVDVAGMAADTLFVFKTSGVSMPFTAQFAWAGITGTTDGSVCVYESNANDYSRWDLIECKTIASADGHNLVTSPWCGSKYLGIRIVKNNMTGGTITYTFNRNQDGR